MQITDAAQTAVFDAYESGMVPQTMSEVGIP